MFRTCTLEEDIKLERPVESFLNSVQRTARIDLIVKLESKRGIGWNDIRNVIRGESFRGMLDDILQDELWQMLAGNLRQWSGPHLSLAKYLKEQFETPQRVICQSCVRRRPHETLEGLRGYPGLRKW